MSCYLQIFCFQQRDLSQLLKKKSCYLHVGICIVLTYSPLHLKLIACSIVCSIYYYSVSYLLSTLNRSYFLFAFCTKTVHRRFCLNNRLVLLFTIIIFMLSYRSTLYIIRQFTYVVLTMATNHHKAISPDSISSGICPKILPNFSIEGNGSNLKPIKLPKIQSTSEQI